MKQRDRQGVWEHLPERITRCPGGEVILMPNHHRACSLCGSIVAHASEHFYHFCPHCGARMTDPERIGAPNLDVLLNFLSKEMVIRGSNVPEQQSVPPLPRQSIDTDKQGKE